MEANNYRWDAFISHASEDKESFVKPLARILVARGASIWYDEFSLSIGDSLSASIDKGLSLSRFGIVVLSESFFAKSWPKRELQGLVACEIGGRSTILPIWHGVTHKQVLSFSPPLADKLAADTSRAVPAQIASQILSVIRPDIAAEGSLESRDYGDSNAAYEKLKSEFDRTRRQLAEFQCPVCRSQLIRIEDVPLDPQERDWGPYRSFECGYEDRDRVMVRPCPFDPKFPSLDEYEILCDEVVNAKGDKSWSCVALPKTSMAQKFELGFADGPTEAGARQAVKERYERRRWR